MNQLDVDCMETCIVGGALDGMCVGLVMTNAAGRVSWLNRVAETQLEVTKPDCYGSPLSQLLRNPQMAEFWHEAQASMGTVLGEILVQFPKPVDLKVNATTCMDLSGVCIGRVLLFCDVTADHNAQIQLSREATERLLMMANPDPETQRATEGLTAQELRILRLVGRGEGNQQIAAALEIAPSTVRSHLKHVYRKTGITSRAAAVSFAIHHGLD